MFFEDLFVKAIPWVIPSFLVLSGLYNMQTSDKSDPSKKSKSDKSESDSDMTSG